MPPLWEVVAILASDLHLSHKSPLARSCEPDWYKAMARPLYQVRQLMMDYKCPLIVAGDIFDRWNAPAELINWTLIHLPRCYAVPGQHDLPNHSYKDIRRSAYWTLCQAGLVTNIEPRQPMETPTKTPLRLHGFPFGFRIRPPKDVHDMLIEVAVVHKYVWIKGQSYTDAPRDQRLRAYAPDLKGYNVALFGDNHKGFDWAMGSGCRVVNCGGFMRRKCDEQSYKPSVGLLYADGTVSRHYLDTKEDQFVSPEKLVLAALKGAEMLDFVEELKGLGDRAIDFRQAVERALQKENADEETRRIVLEAFDKFQ